MALFKYLTIPRKGLPDTQGSLAASVLSQAIAEVNEEIQQVLNDDKKRGPYNQQVCILNLRAFYAITLFYPTDVVQNCACK